MQYSVCTRLDSDTVCFIHQQIHHQFKELRNQHDIEVMKSCHVIGMTVTGATIRANMLGKLECEYFLCLLW